MQRGFTLIEGLLSIAIIAILGVLATSYGAASLSRNELRESALQTVDQLRRAQYQTMSGYLDSQWGVHFSATGFVFFKGSSYNAADPDNEPFDFAANVRFTSIGLNGSAVDVVFNRVRGDTAQYGSLVLTDSTANETKTVTVSEVGLIDSN